MFLSLPTKLVSDAVLHFQLAHIIILIFKFVVKTSFANDKVSLCTQP